MASHMILPSGDRESMPVLLGASTSDTYTSTEVGKFAKLGSTTSTFVLAAAGDEIECIISAVDKHPQGGRTVGGVLEGDSLRRLSVVADGAQASPGVAATIAIGDIVVVGTVVAKGTALAADNLPKVCKATTPADVKNRWRVLAYQTGTGGLGSVMTIQRM